MSIDVETTTLMVDRLPTREAFSRVVLELRSHDMRPPRRPA
jgi:hypothetical protein